MRASVQSRVESLEEELEAVRRRFSEERDVLDEWSQKLRSSRRLLEQHALLAYTPMSSSRVDERLHAILATLDSFQATITRDVTLEEQQHPESFFVRHLLPGLFETLQFLGRELVVRNKTVAECINLGGSQSTPRNDAVASAADPARGLTFWRKAVGGR